MHPSLFQKHSFNIERSGKFDNNEFVVSTHSTHSPDTTRILWERRSRQMWERAEQLLTFHWKTYTSRQQRVWSDKSFLHILYYDLQNVFICRMASKISREWQLKRENGIRYRVVIQNYVDEMNFASRMRELHSREFKIGESLFRITIRPDIYSSQREAYVGVFLENLNLHW